MSIEAAVDATWWLGETKGFWIQTGAFFLSAAGAIWVIVHNGVIAKKKSYR